jgi:GT2 family glycosyltransferase
MGTPLISVVLLSFNRPHFLIEAIESVLAQTYPNIEFILVDNLSGKSAEIAAIVAEYPSIKFVQPGSNTGFTGGMNIGLAHATGEYVHLTEDDVLLEPECIQRLFDYAQTNPRAGLISGLLVNRTQQTIMCAGAQLTLMPQYTKILPHLNEPDVRQLKDPFPVTYIIGCMVFARRELLNRLGGFRPSFYMYFEDDDLSIRVTRMGLQLIIVPTARALHFEPPAGKKHRNLMVEFHKLKNYLSLNVVHAPGSAVPGVFLRAVPRPMLGALRRGDFSMAWVYVKASLWNFFHLPMLLRDRSAQRRTARQTAPAAAKSPIGAR